MPYIGSDGAPLHHLNLSGFARYLSQDRLESSLNTIEPKRYPPPPTGSAAGGTAVPGSGQEPFAALIAAVRQSLETFVEQSPNLGGELGAGGVVTQEMEQQAARLRTLAGRSGGQGQSLEAEVARLMDVVVRVTKAAEELGLAATRGLR